MACCLTASSHYLNQYWFSSVRFHGIHLRGLSLDDLRIPINKTRLKIAVLIWHLGLPGANELMGIMMTSSYGNIFRVTGHLPVPGEFPSQRPVTRSFDVFFDLRPNKRLSKQWWGWWFETPSCPLWRQCNVPPGSYCWGYYTGTLQSNQVSATHLKIEHP